MNENSFQSNTFMLKLSNPFSFSESSFNVKRSDSTENIQATYNILIYNDHIPSQNYRPFRSRPMFPEQTLGSGGSTFDSNLRHSRIGQFVGHPDSNLKRSRGLVSLMANQIHTKRHMI